MGGSLGNSVNFMPQSSHPRDGQLGHFIPTTISHWLRAASKSFCFVLKGTYVYLLQKTQYILRMKVQGLALLSIMAINRVKVIECLVFPTAICALTVCDSVLYHISGYIVTYLFIYLPLLQPKLL